MTRPPDGTCQHCGLPSYAPMANPDHPCCVISITKHFKPSEWCPCLLPTKGRTA